MEGILANHYNGIVQKTFLQIVYAMKSSRLPFLVEHISNKSRMPIWSMKLTGMCDLVMNLQIMNSGSRSCHTRAFWSLRDGHR
jgi:hypothetical protein